MASRTKLVLKVETVVVLSAFVRISVWRFTAPKGCNIYRENSPSGRYGICISEYERLRYLFGNDSYTIDLWEEDETYSGYRASMHVDIPNAGKKATYKINWEQEYVEIVFENRDKSHIYYRLPLKEC